MLDKSGTRDLAVKIRGAVHRLSKLTAEERAVLREAAPLLQRLAEED